jgi:hypothetical protein
VTVRFARNILTDPSKRSDRSRLVCGGHRPIGARSGIRGIYAGWIMSHHGVIHAPVVDHLSA